MTRNIVVTAAAVPTLAERELEMCEHKGAGHPDTLTDAACEAASVALAKAYIETYGAVRHFNVDKGLLIGGRTHPRFGGGAVMQPFKLIVCGRAANPAQRLDLRALVQRAAVQQLQRSIRSERAEFSVECELREGSAQLQQIYAAGHYSVANDTSFGVGYAPLSQLEALTLEVAALLRSPDFRKQFTAAGDDFKIMAVRRMGELSLTVALAIVDADLRGVREYFEVKSEMRSYLLSRAGSACGMVINALDDPHAKDERGLYLTVTGLSAEMGDDGQVGRGNRVNGLITPGRAMSLEAAAGKNPRSHVGKLYNVLAKHIAETICAEIEEVREATVQLVSRIGLPVGQPWAVSAEIRVPDGMTAAICLSVQQVVEREMELTDEWSLKLADGGYAVY